MCTRASYWSHDAMRLFMAVSSLAALNHCGSARNDGLARTPPMVYAPASECSCGSLPLLDVRTCSRLAVLAHIIWQIHSHNDMALLMQGWSSWYAFGTDINETKILQIAFV